MDTYQATKNEDTMRADESTRIIIVGNAQVGKSTIANLMAAMLMTSYQDSSDAMLGVVETHLALEHGLHYPNRQALRDDRFNHRPKWKSSIQQFCEQNGRAAVADIIYKQNGHRIYVGPRCMSEFHAIRESFSPLAIWVRRDSVPSSPDLDIEQHDCDVVLDNSGIWSHTVSRLLTAIRRTNLDGSHQLGRY
jgi:hypothetical protein